MQKDCWYYAKKYDVISSYFPSGPTVLHSFGPGFAPYVFKMASSQQKWSIEIILNRRISTEQRQVPWGSGRGGVISSHYFFTVITITKNFLYLVAIGHHKFDYTGFNLHKVILPICVTN